MVEKFCNKDAKKSDFSEQSELHKRSKKWFEEEGLHFKCTGCGKCCTGSPGYVWVNEKEMEELALFLNIPLADFKRLYVRRVGNRYSLTESRKTYDCVFLNGKQCRVYEARPIQCRTYPWWPKNLESKEAWEETAKTCEGINQSAPLVSTKHIEQEELIQIGRNAQPA